MKFAKLGERRSRFRFLKQIVIKFKILLWLIIPLIMILVLRTSFVAVKNIDCKTQYGPCSEFDNKALDILLGKNLFFLSAEKIKKELLRNPTTEDVSVQKVFPNKVEIIVKQRKPNIVIAQEGFEERGVFVVNREGVILEFAKNSPLPTLVITQRDEDWAVGAKVNDKVIQASNILTLLHQAQRANRAKLENNYIVVNIEESNVYFPLDKEADVLVGALQLLMSRSRIEGRLPKVVDLRYSNPVLKY